MFLLGHSFFKDVELFPPERNFFVQHHNVALIRADSKKVGSPSHVYASEELQDIMVVESGIEDLHLDNARSVKVLADHNERVRLPNHNYIYQITPTN